MDITQVITDRYSVRNYIDKNLSVELLKAIKDIVEKEYYGPFGNKITLKFIDSMQEYNGKKIKIGTYGYINGARYFIVGLSEQKEYWDFDFGYVFQEMILELTELGLGSCWMGGTFTKGRIRKILNLKKSDAVPCVAVFGYADESKKAERPKKQVEEFIFDTSFELLEKSKVPTNVFSALELLRKAPSAVNQQPWRLVFEGDYIHFFINIEARLLGRKIERRLKRIDIGIAAKHFDIGADLYTFSGKWVKNDTNITVPDDNYYFVSYKLG